MRRLFIGVVTAAAALVLDACSADPAGSDGGGAGPTLLQGVAPLQQPLTANAPVRTIVVRYEERAGSQRRDTACGLTALLFNTTVNPQVVPTTTDPGGCRLYTTTDLDADLQRQRWLCAGALNVSSGPLMTTFGMCPTAGARVTYDATLDSCGSIASTRAATVTSMGELGAEDVVTDLNAALTFPALVRITAPNDLGLATWAATGALEVRWTSADATSALVTLEPETQTPGMFKRIVCNAVLNGYVSVPSNMIDQAGLRTVDTRLKVWSFRDGTTMAEGNNTYRVAGATVSNFTLQGRR